MSPPNTPSTVKTSSSTEAAAGEAVAELRRFHYAPPDEKARPDEKAGRGGASPYRPALVAALLDTESPRPRHFRSSYPLFLGPPQAREGAFVLSLGDLLLRMMPASDDPEAPSSRLRDHLGELERRVRRLAATQILPIDARELLRQAGKELVGEIGDGELQPAVDLLVAAIPAGGKLLPWSELVPLHLLFHAARTRLAPARSAFRDEVRAAADRARHLLARGETAGDAGDAGASKADLGLDMGRLGSRFVNPGRLAEVARHRKSGPAIDGPRREALEAALATLEAHLAEKAPAPALLLVHDGHHRLPGFDRLPGSEDDDSTLRTILREDPTGGAGKLFDEEAAKLARLLAAIRRVRLEDDGRYDPARHDAWLEQLDWQAFSREELLLLMPVVALVTADQIAGRGMASLSRLLLSGRPVQTLVLTQPARNPGPDGSASFAGYRLEPAYLGLAHREALVEQTTSARPAHLLRGLYRALSATHSGLHVLATGLDELASRLAVESRAHPLFFYDPEAGAHWAERLDFGHNPAAEGDWSHPELGVDEGRPYTFADHALLDPAAGGHFLPVPEGLAEDELVTIEEYCSEKYSSEKYSSEGHDPEDRRVPFVEAVDGDGRPVRLAVSRALALACRDRLDFWRTLQELAGVKSEYARRATVKAERQGEARWLEERARLEELHAVQLEKVRREATMEAAERMTAGLLGGDLGSLMDVPSAFAEPAASAPVLTGQSVEGVAEMLMRLLETAEDGAGGSGNEEQVRRLEEGLTSLLA